MLKEEHIEDGAISIDLGKERLIFRDPVKVIDADWVKNKFLTSLSMLDQAGDLTLFTTSADRKITGTGLGRSLALNPPYAFTRYTDPPVPGRLKINGYTSVADLDKPLGMGTYYSKAIDDNNATSLLYIMPGVVKFSSLASVFLRAVSYKTAIIANEGRYPHMYDVGNFLGATTVTLFFPVRTLLIYTIATLTKPLTLMSDHSYYSVKPTPMQYWQMVQNITNSLAAERGILAFNIRPQAERVGGQYTYDNYRMSYLIKNFPTIFNKTAGVNVFSIATRTQKNIFHQLLSENIAAIGRNVRSAGDVQPVTDKYDEEATFSGKVTAVAASTLKELADSLKDNPIYTKNEGERGIPKTEESPPSNLDEHDPDGLAPLPSEKSTFLGSLVSAGLATSQHGADGPVFHVDYLGATTDTFSNTLKDIPLKDKMNSIGGAARDIRFSVAGGNLVGDTVDAVTNGVKDLVAGAASGLTFGISDLIFGLLNGSYMRFGKMWQDSTAQLESFTFKMRVGGPYNNKISQLIDQDLVVAAVLAIVLPQSAGSGTYTSPLMVKAFMRGVCNLDRAMVTAVTITKGNGNLGHTQEGRATNLEINVTITDMSELLVAPLGDALYNSFNQESALGRYIATLAGRDFRTNTFLYPKIKMAASIKSVQLETSFSGEAIGMLLADTMVGDIVGFLTPDITTSTFNEALK